MSRRSRTRDTYGLLLYPSVMLTMTPIIKAKPYETL